jgi:hypothetical protein
MKRRLDNQGQTRPSQPIQLTSTNQKTLFPTVNFSLMHFNENIQFPMNPFCAKNFKTNYVMPYGDHGTERATQISKGDHLACSYVSFQLYTCIYMGRDLESRDVNHTFGHCIKAQNFVSRAG